MINLEEENGSISVSDAIKITELDNKVQNLQNKVEELENTNKQLEEKNKNYEEELVECKGKSAVLGEVETAKANLESEISTLNQQVSEFKEGKEKMDIEIQELKNDIMKKDTEIANTQRDSSSSREDIQEKQNTIDKLRDSLNEVESIKTEYEAQVEQLKDDVATIENKYNELLADSSRVEQTKDQLRDGEERLRRFQIIAESDPSYSWLSTLEQYKVIELKRLAMSTGSSTHAILRYVQMLEKAGLVEIEMHGKDDPNPTIKLK